MLIQLSIKKLCRQTIKSGLDRLSEYNTILHEKNINIILYSDNLLAYSTSKSPNSFSSSLILSTSLLTLSFKILAYIWVVLTSVCPNILEMLSTVMPLVSINVANVCLPQWILIDKTVTSEAG